MNNVEVLPAYEKEDKSFIIPNTENGGSWDKFDPRKQIDEFQSSNRSTNGMTAELTRMMKTWVNNISTCDYKSFYLLNDVIYFFEKNFKTGANYSEYSAVTKKFFQFFFPLVISNPIEEKKIRVFTNPSSPYGSGSY